jgi:hypothetical protein
MNKYGIYCFLILLSATGVSWAEPIDPKSTFWQCSIQDGAQLQWTSQSTYRKIALTLAYDACKKNSQSPASCRMRRIVCDHFIAGINISPMWRCAALDREANLWRSNLYPHREEAAMAAKAYCAHNSDIPRTCYVNLITCVNKNEL